MEIEKRARGNHLIEILVVHIFNMVYVFW